MTLVGHWLSPPDSDPLDSKCWLSRYKGLTWREVIDRDLEYVEWILFESGIILDPQLRSSIADAISELLPMVEGEINDKD